MRRDITALMKQQTSPASSSKHYGHVSRQQCPIRMSPVLAGVGSPLQDGVALACVALEDVLRCHFVNNQLRLIVSSSTHCLLLLCTAALLPLRVVQ
jgi:hypothetical protein